MIKRSFIKIFFSLFALAIGAQAANIRNYPLVLRQPNGLEIHVYASGNEYYNWLHDKDNYTILQDPETGYYVYAIRGNDGDLVPSFYIVGLADPAGLGLEKGLKRPPEKVKAEIQALLQIGLTQTLHPAPKTGALNNLVIFIRFSDEAEFTNPTSTYTSMFNDSAAGANSMFNYFKEASYNVFFVNTTFYPIPPGTTVISYQDGNPRGYYQPYNATTNPIGYTGGNSGSQRTTREHILLKNAVNAVSSQVPVGLNIDGDGDGYVDNVCFIVSGDPTAWASLLWPHMWSLYTQTAYINGKRVDTYNFQLCNYLNSRGVGVLCHEMCHSLDAPDLYHYSYDGLQPVYMWDIMEDDQNPPQHMGAYMKYKYMQWIPSLPVITGSAPPEAWMAGIYTLNPLTSSTNNCYRISSPNSTTEFFVVEYRRKIGTFENSIPGTGLLVYRINTSTSGNANGPPDEVYIYRPNGTLTQDGQPQNAHYSAETSRTSINDGTNPSSFLSNGGTGGLNISNVSTAGATISFTLGPPVVVPPIVSTTPVSAIGTTTATSGGTVASDGNAPVTARGVCWSTAPNPTTANSKTIDGSGLGTYTSNITGLSPNTAYHVRAYATNTVGTGYGNDLTFTTGSTVYTVPFSESFPSSFPANWSTQNIGTGITQRWNVSSSAHAGGAPNEMRCEWQDVYPGTTRLITPPLQTFGYSSLNLSYKHFYDDFGPGATLKIQTSVDGANWTNESWFLSSGAGNVGPATVNTTITHNLNSSTTFVAFVVTGDLFEIDAWYIDDVSITSPSVNTILSVTPDAQNVSSSPGTTTFNVANTGAGTMNWSAAITSGGGWLSISSGSSGTNSGTITAAFTQNTDTALRTGTIRVTAPGAAGSPKDVTITQAGAQLQYQLTIEAGGGGTTTPAPGTYTYANGSSVSVTAIPNTNYRFDKWTGDGSGSNNPIAIVMDRNKAIKANFLRQYHLTIAAGTGGTTNPAPGDQLVDSGTVVSVTALPNTNYRFLNWSGSVTGTSNPVNVTMDADKAVTANFMRQYHLTIAAGAGGTTNPTPGDHILDSGAVVSVTALPDTNYRFLNWSGSVTGTSNPVNVIMDDDKTATANFQRIIYPASNSAGQQVLNRSLSQAEYINVLTWSTNANNVNITGYKIYLVVGGQKTELATITADNTSFTYQHRKVTKGQEYTYLIVAVNNEAREGDPATIVVR